MIECDAGRRKSQANNRLPGGEGFWLESGWFGGHTNKLSLF